MSLFILTVTVEISDQTGRSEVRVVGAFTLRRLAEKAQANVEAATPLYRQRRTAYKITEVLLDVMADWGAA